MRNFGDLSYKRETICLLICLEKYLACVEVEWFVFSQCNFPGVYFVHYVTSAKFKLIIGRQLPDVKAILQSEIAHL